MRCAEILQELSTPTGQVDRAALNDHLATCSTCAHWANQVSQLDRAWAETRPAEPDAADFQRIWTAASAQAASQHAAAVAPGVFSPAPHVSLPLNGRPPATTLATASRRRWVELGLTVSGLAAAAALMAALVHPMLLGRPTVVDANPPAAALRPLIVRNFETEPGQTLFIHISGSNATAETRPPLDISDTVTVAAEYDILNFMESQQSQEPL